MTGRRQDETSSVEVADLPDLEDYDGIAFLAHRVSLPFYDECARVRPCSSLSFFDGLRLSSVVDRFPSPDRLSAIIEIECQYADGSERSGNRRTHAVPRWGFSTCSSISGFTFFRASPSNFARMRSASWSVASMG